MAKREDAHLVVRDQEAVQGDVAGSSVRDDELAQFAVDAPAGERVRGQVLDRRLNRQRRIAPGRGSGARHRPDRGRNVVERAGRIDYRRHGFGRGSAAGASLAIQACTSSAR